jgi:hypothetical protein
MKKMMTLVMCVFMFSCFPENVNNIEKKEEQIITDDMTYIKKLRKDVIKEYDNLKLFKYKTRYSWGKKKNKDKENKESEILIENIINKIFVDIKTIEHVIKNDCDKLYAQHLRVYDIGRVLEDEYKNITEFKKSDLNLEETDRVKQLNCNGSLNRTIESLDNYLREIRYRAEDLYCKDEQFYKWLSVSCR